MSQSEVERQPQRTHRRCRHCRSEDVRRSSTRGPFERVVRAVFGLRAYRCRYCGDRFLARLA